MRKLYNKKYLLLLYLISFQIHLSAQSLDYKWGKSIGGTSFDESRSITIDAFGNTYTTGYFSGTVDFDPNSGIYNLTSTATDAIYISKLDAAGNFVWAKAIGGTPNSNFGNSIKVDANGNVYVTGFFSSTADFDPGIGTANLISNGIFDAFILKLDNNGDYMWAKNFGNTQYSRSNALEIDQQGNVLLTGYFVGTIDFDPSPNVFNLNTNGIGDVFVLKLDAGGNFVWAKNVGGANFDIGNCITTDSNGNVYIVGDYEGAVDFDPSASIFNLTPDSAAGVFLLKLDLNGNFIWAKNLGGRIANVGRSIAVDSFGNIYATGYFDKTSDFDPSTSAYNLTPNGPYDIFLLKLNSLGAFVWVKQIGGANVDVGRSLFLDSYGHIYYTGFFSGTVDFNTGLGTYNLYDNGFSTFILKTDTAGNFLEAKNIANVFSPGASGNYGQSIVTDYSGNVYATGYYYGIIDLNTDAGTEAATANGLQDFFIVKLGPTALQTNDYSIGKQHISVYPNPNNGEFTLSAKVSGVYDLKDELGQTIKSVYLHNTNRIKLVDLKSGLYFIQSQNNNYSEKIIVLEQ